MSMQTATMHTAKGTPQSKGMFKGMGHQWEWAYPKGPRGMNAAAARKGSKGQPLTHLDQKARVRKVAHADAPV